MSETNPTVTYEQFVNELFAWSGDLSKDMAHALLGVYTELYEYFQATEPVNALEELGDIEFYVTALAFITSRVTLVPVDELMDKPVPDSVFNQSVDKALNHMMDQCKRWIAYLKVPQDLPEILLNLRGILESIGRNNDFDRVFDQKLRRSSNMAKLLKRYPDGKFDAYRALNRDLEAERLVLEAQ